MHSSIYALIFILFFITSCDAQDKSNLRKSNVIKTTSSSSKAYDWSNQATIYDNKKSNLPDSASKVAEYLREIHQDRKGNLWFGTLTRGVARYDGDTLIYFSKEEGLINNQVNGIAEDKDGNLWFATQGGVSKFDGTTFKNYTTNEGLNDNSLWSILVDSKNNIWVGTMKGVSRFDGNKFSNFPLPKADIKNQYPVISKKLIWEIIEDSKGNIWFGTDGLGAVKYDGKQFTHFTKKDGLNTNVVNSIFEDSKGNFWFGSSESRVPSKENQYHYVSSNDGGLSFYDGKSFTQFPDLQALIAKDIATIYEDSYGYIWIASKHNGIIRYDGETFTRYMEQDGIARYNCVQSILEDNNGTLWVGFSGGLFQLKGEELLHFGKKELMGN